MKTETYNKCTSQLFKRDISELCDKCPLINIIQTGIDKQIISQALEQKELLTKQQFEDYINSEVENAKGAMQRVSLTEQQNENNQNDKYRAKRIEIYIWNKERIKALNNIISPVIHLKKMFSETLKFKLTEYKFFELEKVKCLSENGQKELVRLLTENDLPYKIAMLNHLDFLKFLLKEYFKTKQELNIGLGKVLDSTERAIKGNINVLDEYSKEDKNRYTSYKHKEKIIKEYENLK